MTSRRSRIVCAALLVLTALVGVWVPLMVRAAPGGVVWAWGENGNGQLGNGPGSLSPTPVQVGGLIGVTDIAAGSAHNLALGSDGSVWAWGANARGQLGNGTVTDSPKPIPVGGLGRAVAVAAGTEHSLALLADGTVWAWGANDAGQLGEASRGTCGRRDAGNPVLIGCSPTPVQVKGLSGVTSVASEANHNLALVADGAVWAWGANIGRAVLGPGAPESGCDFTSCSRTPTPVDGLTEIADVAARPAHSLALGADGNVWVWGANSYGYDGRPGPDFCSTESSEPITCRPTPSQVVGLGGVTTIAAGGAHNLALGSEDHLAPPDLPASP